MPSEGKHAGSQGFKMKQRLLIVVALISLSGCQYYRARDMSTGRSYITNNWQMHEDPGIGRLDLRDSRTGEEVTLHQSYQIDRLDELETIAALRSSKD
jgi:hypothetical protein